jgi:uncharacterized protein (UPF0335 family)
MPSAQLSNYLSLRASGEPVERASEVSGIPLAEAELHEADIASGELELPRVRAPAPTREGEPKEEIVARDNEPTISLNGGPEHSLSEVREALDIVKRSTGPSVAAQELRLFIERIERVKAEVKDLNADVADIYKEAKAQGYDAPTMRRIIRLRGMGEHDRQEAAALLETYADALGLQGALPL